MSNTDPGPQEAQTPAPQRIPEIPAIAAFLAGWCGKPWNPTRSVGYFWVCGDCDASHQVHDVGAELATAQAGQQAQEIEAERAGFHRGQLVAGTRPYAELQATVQAQEAEIAQLTAELSQLRDSFNLNQQFHEQECDELQRGRWRTFTRDCPRTLPNIPMVEGECSCVDCVEMRNERKVQSLTDTLTRVREEAFRAGYHCRWHKETGSYNFDPLMAPGDPSGAYAAWLALTPPPDEAPDHGK